MKKLYKFIGMGVIALTLSFSLGSVKVNASEPVVENEQTELSSWFEGEVMQYILTFATSAAGAFAIAATFLKTIKNAVSLFKKTKDETVEMINKTVETTKDDVKQLSNDVREQVKDIHKTRDEILDDNKVTREELNRVIEVLRLVYTNDAVLVKKGISSDVEKLLGDKDENN